MKPFTNISANTMLTFLADYIHSDQVSFLPYRQVADRVRTAIDLISLLHSSWDGGLHRMGMLLPIDIHKAFDSLSWPFIFRVLTRWNFILGLDALVIQFTLGSDTVAGP